MCNTEDPGSEPDISTVSKDQVVSLCAHRRQRMVAEATEELVGHLTHIHQQAIEVHNQVINHAELSVLTELCRTVGLCLDLVDSKVQAAVVTPAALYGDSRGRVFGKEPLQRRIESSIKDKIAASILGQLQTTCPAVWEYLPGDSETLAQVTPLAGPGRGHPAEIGGIIARAGEISRTTGVYSGWMITFRGVDFIVFGHRLDRRREVSVRDMLATREDVGDSDFWNRIELDLLRAIIDPTERHRPPEQGRPRDGIRPRTSRNGIVLTIRRTLWRRFAEPEQGLNLHAHLAALIDEPHALRAFIDEVRDIIDAVTIKSGGLQPQTPPIDVDEILAPFHADSDGNLSARGALRQHPIALLMLDEMLLKTSELGSHRPIIDALLWAKHHSDEPVARHIESAWMSYRTEQNLMATYGYAPGTTPVESDDKGGLSFVSRSSVLPNIRILFDPRFTRLPLSRLELGGADRSRLQRALEKKGSDLQTYTLNDIPGDERALSRLRGVSHRTCNAVRSAILALAAQWRWREVGLSSVSIPISKPNVRDIANNELLAGLDHLDEYFDE